MEIDPQVLEKLKGENTEFKRLFEEHITLKNKVEELNRLKYLTSEQELEKKNYQKEKLKTKDRLEQILSQYQATLH
ncbi:MAG: DUF465 domain-containing protein [Nitrospinae bacterium CG11_big_fil_rev_8_21_14_0_20_56_8]|nr:MAG: DUF465 domain-containing protein [Nitrospinae bacterium CG11_big_fil_rev_8_21_14_0_20_56_8]